MPHPTRVETVVPSAARTVASLRDIGYELPHAIADLIDNSIAAGASEVAADLHFEGGDSWIRIADNGSGMVGPQLTDAMRYGTERSYDEDDLGKFGFGLKTASTSQCREVWVASRVAPQRARIEARCLDLDHIEATNRWEILIHHPSDRPTELGQPLQNTTGTVILWRNLDRVLEYQDPWGEWARRRMLSLAEEIDLHLGMVFHRFLSGQVPRRPLQITVNGARVVPWDPFCRDEPATEELPGEDVRISNETGAGIVRVIPYVVPPQTEFSSEAAWRRASGPSRWNRQQGFYIYRAHRMIQSGGWSRMRTSDEHTKLARVSLDFFPELDAAFGINIAKARVTLPLALRDEVEALIQAVTRRAQARYRSGGEGTGGAGSNGRGGSAGRGGGRGQAGRSGRSRGTGGPTVVRGAIEGAAATVGETEALGRIVAALRQGSPEVASELGW